ncbi:MAG TPA: TonB-dependent receptor [Candidatus Acidoferrales bacterium]|nr:TonB-dependent receptor [Candidatus Acidoferrales bacterium]
MQGIRFIRFVVVLCVLAVAAFAVNAQGANSGSIQGVVKDATGAAVPSAQVEISDVVSGYHREAKTNDQGQFAFSNVPFNGYHLVANAAGFAALTQDVDVRSAVPVSLELTLKVGSANTTVTVSAEAQDLVETTPTAHTDVDVNLFGKLPLESQSSSITSLITLSTPGVFADSNGNFHGLGDHAQNSFSVDGQPITDQQSKVFSNQIPLDSVQSLEVIEGAPPAEFGDKTSLVIKVTTRSGLGQTKPTGSVYTSYGNFGTANLGFDLAAGGNKWGNYVAVNGLNSGRFLDPPEFSVMHDKGNQQNFFDRADFKLSANNSLQLNLGYIRSWFQTPNSFDAQTASAWSGLVVDNGGLGPNGLPVGPADQRSQIKTFNIAPTFTHLIGSNALFTVGLFARKDQYNYFPSNNPFADLLPDLQSETVGQSRRLTNLGVRSDISYVKGHHNFKAGVTYEHTLLNEKDSFGIVDPTLNPVCDNADGSINTNPLITNPAQCGGVGNPGGSADPNFTPLLGCFDLTRTAPLPASDGCAAGFARSGLDNFLGHSDIKELALYVQDAISWRNWTVNIGVRGDFYNGLSTARQAEPRVGLAYNIKRTNTVLRLSYAHTFETPFNENLVLSSLGCNDAAINAIMSVTIGQPCLTSPLSPGLRNEYHAGFEQAFGRYLVLDAEYIWKYTHNAYDFSVFGSTPLTFPIEWQRSKIPGYTLRATVPNYHGFTAYFVASHVAARFFAPQVTGIGATPGAAGGVFRIDHDENFEQTTHLQYQIGKRGPWIGFNWRYDSGLVAGPIPCAGGNCNNGPNGTDSIVDVSGLSPDQQFEAGLFCGSVHATPTTPISANGLCPASQYGSTLISVPVAGTEDDDHNPPRIAPRHLFDASIGDDDLFHGDRFKWSLRLTVINLTNKTALYNFLSTFSGTHYVTPRTATAELGFHF